LRFSKKQSEPAVPLILKHLKMGTGGPTQHWSRGQESEFSLVS
jgi:hypothetical protein